MIVEEQITAYLHSLEKDRGELDNEMLRYAKEHQVPIIRSETLSLLETIIIMNKPTTILEVGTAIGYSAINMYKKLKGQAAITTIERDEAMLNQARLNITKAGLADKILVLEGEAEEKLKELSERNERYDFVFMDAAKGQYINFLPYVTKLLNRNGILFSDNVLQDGEVAYSRYGIERRNRTIHARMREYLFEIKHSEYYETSIVPIGDGVAISVKQKD